MVFSDKQTNHSHSNKKKNRTSSQIPNFSQNALKSNLIGIGKEISGKIEAQYVGGEHNE